jgi:hypothetical protein
LKEPWCCAKDVPLPYIEGLFSAKSARRAITDLTVKCVGVASESLCRQGKFGSWSITPISIRGAAKLSRLKARTGKRKLNRKGVV